VEAPVPATPVTCGQCEKSVYFPQQGHFPPVVPLTFASQASAPVPLLPFFHAEMVVVPPELTDVASGGNGAAHEPPIQSPQAQIEEEPARLPDGMLITEEPEELPTLEGEPMVEDAVITPGPMQSSGEDMQLLSLAGGSFAAALTPPPSENEPSTSPATMGALGPAPWDPAKPNGEEQWSVATVTPSAPAGPPPLAGPPKLKLPPPVPKKGSVDEIALALGLPQLDDRPPQQPLPTGPSQLTQSTVLEEELLNKKSKKNTLIIAGVVLAISIGVVYVITSRATKELEKPLEPPKQPQVASAPTNTRDDGHKIDPQKRAQAIELYNRGNKLYLQKKFKEAELEYKRALDTDPQFALAYRGLGVTYASQEKNQKAIEAYKSYLKLAPDAKDAKLVKQIIKEAEQK
jgi:hypothetical protein